VAYLSDEASYKAIICVSRRPSISTIQSAQLRWMEAPEARVSTHGMWGCQRSGVVEQAHTHGMKALSLSNCRWEPEAEWLH